MTPENYPEQVFIHPERPHPDRLDPISNRPQFKPEGGLWTSSYRDESSAWVNWMQAEQWYNHSDATAWLLTPDDPDIYQIDTLTDLKVLASEFPNEDSPLSYTALDYEAIADVFDGIWLTQQGQWQTRFSHPNLYGWDCESTLWFEWCFENAEPIEMEIYK